MNGACVSMRPSTAMWWNKKDTLSAHFSSMVISLAVSELAESHAAAQGECSRNI